MELTDGQNMQDLVIVSAFGRGNWLARETARLGWKTTLVDISETLAPFSPEEVEGPFGLLEAEDLLESQIARVKDEGESVVVPEGFNLWLKDGPIEFRGPVISHQLAQKKISKEVTQYLLRGGLSDRTSERERKGLDRGEFSETWLAHLSHQIASPLIGESGENHEALDVRDHWPVFSRFSIRQVTIEGLKKGLQNCAAEGVTVHSQVKVRDLVFDGKDAASLTIQSEGAKSETNTLKAHSFVWMLSSFETRKCPSEIAQTLFPAGPVEPKWYWARLQFGLEAEDVSVLSSQLPSHTVILDDPFLPWTHANLLVLRKRSAAAASDSGIESGVDSNIDSGFDVWAKLPVHFTSQPQRLLQFAQEVQLKLETRIPKTKFVFKSVGDAATASRLIRQPLFEPRELKNLQMKKSNNLFFCGPEQWDFVDWLGSFRAQNRLFPVIEKMKTQWDARLARLAAKAAAREARERASASVSSNKENNL